MTESQFGHLNELAVGQIFPSREALRDAGVHSPLQAGIWGREREGACSIVMSGGYEDDIDELDYIRYTGHGGQEGPSRRQIRDQEFKRGNLALKTSFENNFPIRVTRGFQIPNGPASGYRYDGIYYITHVERVIGKSGYFVCLFHLQSENAIENLEKLLRNNLKQDYQRVSRTQTSVSKLDRNPMLAGQIKRLYDFRCQVCDCRLDKPGGAIAVGAHIRGLGRPHEGPDDISNMICLCPNHHAQFDAFAFYVDSKTLEIRGLTGIEGRKLRIADKHKIDMAFFEYHAQQYEKAKHL